MKTESFSLIHRVASVLILSLSPLLSSCMLDLNRSNIEAWHRLRSQGEVARVKHDYYSAQKAFEEALKLVEPMTDQPVRAAVSLEELSKICMDTTDIRLSASICSKALSLASKRSQAPTKQQNVLEIELGQCFINIGTVFLNTRKYDLATIAFREARVLFSEVYKKCPPIPLNFSANARLALATDGLGTSLKELGQLKEARSTYFGLGQYNAANGLSDEFKKRILANFCSIPYTTKEDKEKYAKMLGVSL